MAQGPHRALSPSPGLVCAKDAVPRRRRDGRAQHAVCYPTIYLCLLVLKLASGQNMSLCRHGCLTSTDRPHTNIDILSASDPRGLKDAELQETILAVVVRH